MTREELPEIHLCEVGIHAVLLSGEPSIEPCGEIATVRYDFGDDWFYVCKEHDEEEQAKIALAKGSGIVDEAEEKGVVG